MKGELPQRLVLLGSSVIFLVIGVIGVSGSRDIAARYGNIQIPVAWYLFPIMLAVLVAVSALLLPAAALRWRRGVVGWVLFLVTLLLGSTSPLLYTIYDFEHRLRLLREQQSHESISVTAPAYPCSGAGGGQARRRSL
jgi:hypothetical protein